MVRRARLICVWMIAAATASVALPAAARPYLMLDADDHGFKALDLGAIDRADADRPLATVIEAPLAGVEVGGRVAPLVERRVQVDCASPRWRFLAVAYLDGQEHLLAGGGAEADPAWADFGGDVTASAVQAAACGRAYRAQAVSRFRNLGEILANYQAAHAKAAPQPPTEKELQARRFRNSH